ncbi:hypothetical protein M8C13_00380 [Crossiella sp. SN42]|uniref:hypothetical protein n=1 Tax=Crossiella sp. SN42 TaxID=2944808 RepID=UPI00207D1893|nr:hypothetical protein [Crossiella sp. SN42]MCO1574213.1 hypothetical protein [Crossiella sp. SN42]
MAKLASEQAAEQAVHVARLAQEAALKAAEETKSARAAAGAASQAARRKAAKVPIERTQKIIDKAREQKRLRSMTALRKVKKGCHVHLGNKAEVKIMVDKHGNLIGEKIRANGKVSDEKQLVAAVEHLKNNAADRARLTKVGESALATMRNGNYTMIDKARIAGCGDAGGIEGTRL